ncbi:reverse transcriptase domain-containing protein [Tanacetum coccineum]
MKCQPLNFKDTEGVVELTQWFEKMETVFRISNCSVENQIKFSTCTLLGSALTWWNSHVRTVGHDVAYAMTWTDLKKKMSDKYCPRSEIKKLEVEMWDLKVKGTDVICYNQCFQELEWMCVRMFPEEYDKVEKYVGGLPDMLHGSVVALICADIAKITRKWLKSGKHEHGNGRARKNPGGSYQSTHTRSTEASDTWMPRWQSVCPKSNLTVRGMEGYDQEERLTEKGTRRFRRWL